jgi:hypothetical protein
MKRIGWIRSSARWALNEADRMDPLFNIKCSPDIEGVYRPAQKNR